ncbi:MAG: hypothetical protein VX893_12435 [Candidatus Latescibacterota bacterium]|nr:hypothetical protein [Candidatus Latescibacterota bacterium]
MNWSPTPSDAFLGHAQSTVLIGMKRGGDDTYTLQIRDDGIGLPNDLNSTALNSLGLTLMQILVRQLRGQLAMN